MKSLVYFNISLIVAHDNEGIYHPIDIPRLKIRTAYKTIWKKNNNNAATKYLPFLVATGKSTCRTTNIMLAQ